MMAMPGVDDTGFCDGTFWQNNNNVPADAGTTTLRHEREPSLKSIAAKAITWLEGTQFDNAIEMAPEEKVGLKNRWQTAQSHTAAKLKVIQTFASSMTPSRSLVGKTTFQPLGAKITMIDDACPFKGQIEVGDRIVTIDGKRVTQVEDLIGDGERSVGIATKPRRGANKRKAGEMGHSESPTDKLHSNSDSDGGGVSRKKTKTDPMAKNETPSDEKAKQTPKRGPGRRENHLSFEGPTCPRSKIIQ